MKAHEIRRRFLKFFEDRDHTVVSSSSLVPHNDPTLLFANAGMNQFKDVFLGQEKREYVRAVSSQKCVRAGGKHNDLENVGFTARHHTFFEMLGNFSFGDYFKKAAISYAWEFVTKELGIKKDVLYVTVFKDDDEAYGIWQKQENVPKERIYRLDEKDNFWAMGETGPCGPCSEIFVDRGAQYSCGKKCGIGQCDCDRYMEIWNLVFMQYNRSADGKMTALPKPSVDTGAGLERLAAVLQNVDSNYDSDLFTSIMNETGRIAGKTYKPDSDLAPAFRVIADHARATTFLIADGVLPSNEGRGYVLRRIIRRAIRLGKKLDFSEPFLFKVCDFVIKEMSDAYPDLKKQRELIQKCVQSEEEQFFRTLEKGLSLLESEMAALKKGSSITGDVAFKLYDTFGFPLDLTRVIAAENNFTIDEKGFDACMAKQKQQSREHWKGSGEDAVSGIYHQVSERLKEQDELPEFVGYTSEKEDGTCVALLSVGKDPKEISSFSADGKSLCEAVFTTTPFYGESGGQVGDRGVVSGLKDDFWADVVDVQKPIGDLIVVRMCPKKGQIEVGKTYSQTVDVELRRLAKKNHTATHLMHWALRKVLGDHVKQAGSLVTPELLRFDLTHFQGLTQEEQDQVEELVNRQIWAEQPVTTEWMSKDEATSTGAIAFFGEKYGDEVRVVKAGEHSVELCGGTHVENTGDIQLFKIASEGGIAAGVRRIVAYTSRGAFSVLDERYRETVALRDRLKAANSEESVQKVERLLDSEKSLRKQIEKMQSKNLSGEIDEIIQGAQQINGISLVTHVCKPDPQGVKLLREMSDRIREKSKSAVVVLGMKDQNAKKAFVLAALGKDVPKKITASEIIKEVAPMIDGRGGGKPDLAQAGGSNLDGVEKALERARAVVEDSFQ